MELTSRQIEAMVELLIDTQISLKYQKIAADRFENEKWETKKLLKEAERKIEELEKLHS